MISSSWTFCQRRHAQSFKLAYALPPHMLVCERARLFASAHAYVSSIYPYILYIPHTANRVGRSRHRAENATIADSAHRTARGVYWWKCWSTVVFTKLVERARTFHKRIRLSWWLGAAFLRTVC